MRRLALICLLALSVGCGSKSSSPTTPSTPTPTPTPTKIIRLLGSMDFGGRTVNVAVTNTLTVFNDGNTALTITGLTGSNGITSVTKASPTTGTVPPGGKMDIAITFTPTAVASYSGVIGVTSDATSGTNTINFVGQGNLNGIPVFSKAGSGDTVFDMPAYVARIHVVGRYPQNSSNFIMKIDGRLIVNELVGTAWNQTVYDGTLLTGGGGVVAITNSSGVQWTIDEVR